jgi:hypothetical protein
MRASQPWATMLKSSCLADSCHACRYLRIVVVALQRTSGHRQELPFFRSSSLVSAVSPHYITLTEHAQRGLQYAGFSAGSVACPVWP